jgi:hypothetical protein
MLPVEFLADDVDPDGFIGGLHCGDAAGCEPALSFLWRGGQPAPAEGGVPTEQGPSLKFMSTTPSAEGDIGVG